MKVVVVLITEILKAFPFLLSFLLGKSKEREKHAKLIIQQARRDAKEKANRPRTRKQLIKRLRYRKK